MGDRTAVLVRLGQHGVHALQYVLGNRRGPAEPSGGCDDPDLGGQELQADFGSGTTIVPADVGDSGREEGRDDTQEERADRQRGELLPVSAAVGVFLLRRPPRTD
jgi:hypothetical protein